MLSLIPQGFAVGLSNLLVILFLASSLKGSVLEVGLLACTTSLVLMPSMVFWGWMADRARMYRPFLIFSFVATGAVLLLVPMVHSVLELFAVAVVKSVAYAASMPSRQILMAESESHASWRSGFARLQFLECLGETAGLGIGFVSSSALGFEGQFFLCGGLFFASALAVAGWVRDPVLVIERRLVGIERFADTLVTASTLVANAHAFPGYTTPGSIRRIFKPTLGFFMFGVFCFSLGAAALSSPLPVYFLRFYPASSVFLLFFANNLGNTVGYLLVGGIAERPRRSLLMAAALRMATIPALFLVGGGQVGFTAGFGLLAVMGGVWALFDVASTCMFLELARSGRVGLYGAFAGFGSAAGALLGGAVSMSYGFAVTFATCSLVYAVALAMFAMQFRGQRSE
ncbi:MAG TPA: MFS transporter [Nitrososphaerales archaeon]|nr:MFS transporter [Nitrososphaerales archaeon]